jgi:putative ABC transport system permease protein
MLLSLAWRNVWRNRRRSAIIVLAIVLGLCGGLFMAGFSEGMVQQLVETPIDRELGHVQIHAPGFTDERAITRTIANADSVAAIVRATPGVAHVVTRALVTAMIASPVTSQGVTLLAVDPADELGMTSVPSTVKDGKYLDSAAPNTVLVSTRLAKKLELRLRGKVVVSFAGPDGTICYTACRVGGTFETESSVYDDRTVLMRRSELAPLIGSHIAHEIALRCTSLAEIDSVRQRLRAALPGLTVESWKERAPEMKLYTEITGLYLTLIMGIVLFALLFGITNTMLMSVLDRVHEFGVLLAVGMRRRRLYVLVFSESLILSVTGGAIGTILGAILVEWLHRTGIPLTMFAEGLARYGMSSTVYPDVPLAFYPQLSLMITATSILAALYPGWKATRLKPAEAIRA